MIYHHPSSIYPYSSSQHVGSQNSEVPARPELPAATANSRVLGVARETFRSRVPHSSFSSSSMPEKQITPNPAVNTASIVTPYRPQLPSSLNPSVIVAQLRAEFPEGQKTLMKQIDAADHQFKKLLFNELSDASELFESACQARLITGLVTGMMPADPAKAVKQNNSFCFEWYKDYCKTHQKQRVSNWETPENKRYLSRLIKNFVFAQVKNPKLILLDLFYDLAGGENFFRSVDNERYKMKKKFQKLEALPSDLLAFFIKKLSKHYLSIRNKPEGYDPIYMRLLAASFSSLLHYREEADLIEQCATPLIELMETEGNSFSEKLAGFKQVGMSAFTTEEEIRAEAEQIRFVQGKAAFAVPAP